MGKKKRPGIIIWIWKMLFKLVLVLVLLSLCQVLFFGYFNPPVTVNMIWERLSFEIWETRYVKPVYVWQDIEEISPSLKRAVMASEDQRFLIHNGFDFQEIKIVIRDMVEKQTFRGASTITMQAARSLFLPASRNPLRKMAEAWYTLLMELFWDKKRILEIYLNTVDWGTGVVGAQAGARKYFSTDAGGLSRSQAALMAAVLPSPHKWSVTHPSAHVKDRQRRILRDMGKMRLP
ncbi:monofunctional biosynthetic peptidoglycan transglycosylase [Desulfospira joergensenii]|uniref:monofunctional biosynthetic peptidoglycan transglycosylase n=1 Tax=Desulfospira joergensenii TaxID=53329 RepID=UPI001FC8F509|nr:monofunctional biosynthetic peptidoglycan transglycosylase [Desulfospira joergensenii]